MLPLKDIILGHLRELTGQGRELSEKRLKICNECPLFNDVLGGICNPKLCLNPKTGEVASYKKTDDFVRGCGCRVLAKSTLAWAECPANKWPIEDYVE